MAKEYGVTPRKTASILDTFSCIFQGVIPYGAQMLMASSLTGIPATSIIPWLFYPAALLVMACIGIIFNYPRSLSKSLGKKK